MNTYTPLITALIVYFVGWVIISYRAGVKLKQTLLRSIAIGAIWPILFVLATIEVGYFLRRIEFVKWWGYLNFLNDNDELSAIRKAKYVAEEAAKRKEKTIWRG